MGIEEGSDGVQTLFFLVSGKVLEVVKEVCDSPARRLAVALPCDALALVLLRCCPTYWLSL